MNKTNKSDKAGSAAELGDESFMSAEELRAFTRERLAHFKTPHSVTFVTELPKTATGKIQKYVLRGKRSAISAQ